MADRTFLKNVELLPEASGATSLFVFELFFTTHTTLFLVVFTYQVSWASDLVSYFLEYILEFESIGSSSMNLSLGVS